jgi:hypothetical protein
VSKTSRSIFDVQRLALHAQLPEREVVATFLSAMF